MKKLIRIVFSIIIGLSFTDLSAALITWDGGAGTTTWSDAANWDSNTVPTALDDVDLNGDTVVLTSSTQVQRVYAGGSSLLTINSGVTLTIDGYTGNDYGLEIQTSATVVNNGNITISNITGSVADGLYNKGTCTNNGTISISTVGRHGVYVVAGTFTNSSTGTISVTGAGQTTTDADGIYLDDANSGSLKGTLTNAGIITVSMTTADDGIYVNDSSTFNNTGTITISGTGGDNGMRVDDRATFNNNTGGTLTFNATVDDPLFLDNTGILNNSGTINIASSPDISIYVTDQSEFNNLTGGVVNISNSPDYCIQVDGNSNSPVATVSNSGTININSGSNDGVRLQEAGEFVNNTGGVLNITGVAQDGIQIDPTSTLTNSGTIEVHGIAGTNSGIEVYGGTLQNNSGGSIIVRDLTTSGDYFVLDNTTLSGTPYTGTVNNAGDITVTISSSSSDDGILVNDGSTFNNTGDVDVNATGSGSGDVPIKVEDGSTWNNNNGGTITITGGHTNSEMLRIVGVSGQTTTFNNNSGATVTVEDHGDKGILVSPFGTFTNGGLIDINANATGTSGTSVYGIEIDNDASLTNSGTIEITGVTYHGIFIEGTFNNNLGATLDIKDVMQSGADGMRVDDIGTVVNNGLFKINGSASDDIEIVSGGSFTNNANSQFEPGASPGEMEIRGAFDLGSSTTTFEITGTTAVTEYDRFDHQTSAVITITNATAHLDWGSYTPNTGDQFKIIDGSGTVSGTFANITSSNAGINYSVDYTTNVDEVLITILPPLPVELITFEGNKTREGIELNWSTASELNNEGFEVEKSTDGKNWTQIGFVKGNGTTSTFNNYSFLDIEKTFANAFYRLRQVDYDGAFEYSDVISIEFEEDREVIVNIYPNPVANKLTVEGFTGKIVIRNSLGQEVKSQRINLNELVSLLDLKKGNYFIELHYTDGSMITQKLNLISH